MSGIAQRAGQRPHLVALFVEIVHRLQRWQIRRRAIRELSLLDDHALKDIGVDRCCIEGAVDHSSDNV